MISLVKTVKNNATKRNFKQSYELIIALKDIDFKKQSVTINEIIQLPYYSGTPKKICFIGTGELALKANNAGADLVLESEQLDKLQGNKKEAKKLAKGYDFFFADPTLMSRVGKVLGQFLGPSGKMPIPVPPTAPIGDIIQKHRNSIRVRTRAQLSVAAKIGDESLTEEQIAENALAVYNAIEKKLPEVERNIKKIYLKLTMSKPIEMLVGVRE